MIDSRTILKVFGASLILMGSAAAASACFWITGTTYDGHWKQASGIGEARLLRASLKLNHREEGLKMQSALAHSTNFNERSDYAVSLVYVGKTKEAVELLEALEKEQPGTYIVAANLGTALELLGKNEEALHWIREGIRRNPESHEGTEWLHAKILEAKIAQEKDRDYFKTHSVLELDPAHASKGTTIDGRAFSSEDIGKAIHYQLQERLQFVKPPDAAVASLLYDYAAIEAATNVLESAKGLLEMAKEYGYPAERVEAQIKLYDGKIAVTRKERHAFHIFVAIFVGVIVIGGLVVLYKIGSFLLSPRKKN